MWRWTLVRRCWPKRAVIAGTINYKLDVLRRFFEHLRDCGHRDAPAEIPIARQPRPPRPSRAPQPVSRQPVRQPAKPTRVPKPEKPSRALPRETTWEEIAAAGTADGGHHDRLSGADHGLSPARQRGGLPRWRCATWPPIVIATDPNCVTVAEISRPHIEGSSWPLPPGRDGKGLISNHDHPPQPGHDPHVLRADHRLGLGRRPTTGADLRRGHPQSRRAAPQVPGRPHRGEVHGHPGRRSRPAPPADGRTVGPHRHESRRAGRHTRRRHVQGR